MSIVATETYDELAARRRPQPLRLRRTCGARRIARRDYPPRRAPFPARVTDSRLHGGAPATPLKEVENSGEDVAMAAVGGGLADSGDGVAGVGEGSRVDADMAVLWKDIPEFANL